MKVLKFGGTSVGTVESLRNVKKIVESIDEQAIVVVSALGGLTDKLISTARAAASGDDSYILSFNEIFQRHQKIIEELIPKSRLRLVEDSVYGLLDELGTIYRGIHLIRDLSSRTLDVVVSYGERMSSMIISNLIENAQLFDSKQFIITQRRLGQHILDNVRTSVAIRKAFGNMDFNVAVVPGFISTDRDSDITNLGRGGSDYTAAILAAALNADILEIWTDVDGFMTTDPRIVKDAFVIERLSFNEAIELCYFGAKVIYPPTLYPVLEKNIPVKVLNTFNPTAPGTLIHNSDVDDSTSSIKGLSYVKETSLIKLIGPFANDIDKFSSRVIPLLDKSGINVFLVDRTDNETIVLAIKTTDAQKAFNLIRTNFASDLQTGMIQSIEIDKTDFATIAIIGSDEAMMQSLTENLYKALISMNVPVFAQTDSAYGINISFVIARDDMANALNIIHNHVFNK